MLGETIRFFFKKVPGGRYSLEVKVSRCGWKMACIVPGGAAEELM